MRRGRPGIPVILSTAAGCGLIILPSRHTEISLLLGELVQLLPSRNRALIMCDTGHELGCRDCSGFHPLKCLLRCFFFLHLSAVIFLSALSQHSTPLPGIKGSHTGRNKSHIPTICLWQESPTHQSLKSEQCPVLTAHLQRGLFLSPPHRDPDRPQGAASLLLSVAQAALAAAASPKLQQLP